MLRLQKRQVRAGRLPPPVNLRYFSAGRGGTKRIRGSQDKPRILSCFVGKKLSPPRSHAGRRSERLRRTFAAQRPEKVGQKRLALVL